MCTVFHPITIAVVLSCFNNVLSSTPTAYKCFEDVCNWDPGTPQYCWDARKMCRKCSDIKDSCREPEMPTNCTDFCIDHELSKVKAKPCSSVDVPFVANGIANITKDQSVPLVQGSKVHFICQEGYRLTGRTSVCGLYGQWSSPPVCQELHVLSTKPSPSCAYPIVCSLPKINGMSFSPSQQHYDVGSHVQIECLDGRKGIGRLTCLSNGAWDHELPRCEDFSPPWQLAAAVTFGITTMILMVIVLICCYRDKRFHHKKSYDIEERSDADREISEETSLVEQQSFKQQHSATEKTVKEQMPTDEKGVSEPDHASSIESLTQSVHVPKVEESRKCGSKVPPLSSTPEPEEQTGGAFGGSDDNTSRLPLLRAGGSRTEVCRRELDSSCNYSNAGQLPHNTPSTSKLPLDSLLGSDTGTGPRSTTETTEGTEEDTGADPSPSPGSTAIILKTGKNGKNTNNGLIGGEINIGTYVHIQVDGQPNDREADTETLTVPVEENSGDEKLPFPVQEGGQKRRTVIVEPDNHDEMEVKL